MVLFAELLLSLIYRCVFTVSPGTTAGPLGFLFAVFHAVAFSVTEADKLTVLRSNTRGGRRVPDQLHKIPCITGQQEQPVTRL